MLLSIDKVLAMLSEGKDIEKIAVSAGTDTKDVVEFIEEARTLLMKYEPDKSRKKIVIKKKIDMSGDEIELFAGADLSAVPVESSLKIFAAVFKKTDQYASGILIKDFSDTLLGKVHYSLTDNSEKEALFSTMIKSMRIASYFKTKSLRLYIDNSPVMRLVLGKDEPADQRIADLLSSFHEIYSSFPDARVEILSPSQNDGAKYLSQKRIKKDKNS